MKLVPLAFRAPLTTICVVSPPVKLPTVGNDTATPDLKFTVPSSVRVWPPPIWMERLVADGERRPEATVKPLGKT